MTPEPLYDDLSREDLLRILMERDADERGALRLHYGGQTPPWQIVRRVRPRCQKIEPKLSFGSEVDQAANLLIEGDNLQSMVSLYKYRGQGVQQSSALVLAFQGGGRSDPEKPS